ncbi:MAG: carboxypeptidase-like regulatory domain-containing protein, partial [Muribaculaceae bacterium]|nr:carboxypeptidase-like regulatory domain-containing protein [Muribaculaceae bacterium]
MENFKHQTFWRYLTAIAMFWFVGVCASAQTITTYGTVTDDEGEPLIGVSVMVQGTTTGATTDVDGNYTIKVAQGSKIVFSYVGMNTQTKNAVNGKLDVVMTANNNALNDLVVVGYGVQR